MSNISMAGPRGGEGGTAELENYTYRKDQHWSC